MNNLLRRLWAGILTISIGLLLFSYTGKAQLWASIVAENKLEFELVPADKMPSAGTFWSLQRTNYPPLPYNPFPELSVYYLGYGNSYLLDDSAVDYDAIYQQREEDRALRQLEWEAGLLSDAEYFALEGGSMAMMLSSLSSSYAYSNAVYLVDLAASFANSFTTASFSIAGGTNYVPYDILTSTNAGALVADWKWIGIGYTSNRYTFSNQPPEQAFYILAKPEKTMKVSWGADDYEQSSWPIVVSNALAVAGGRAHSLALCGDGTVVGWGNNFLGQLNIPTNLAGVTMIACGYYHSVALRTNGSVSAWGYNDTYYNLLAVPADLTNATVIAANGLHSLALRSNGTVVVWGFGTSGETTVPAGLSNVVAIAAGYRHNLAVKADGTVQAWGYNDFGQTDVPGDLSNVVDVAAGIGHSLALREDGTVVAWGRNASGETNVPAGLSNVVAIAAGGEFGTSKSFSLALKKDNTLVAWGNSQAMTPTAGLSNVIAIAGGTDHALAVRSGPRTPVLTLMPTNQFQIAGGSVTFNSRGAGLYGVAYQWKTNGVNLSGATNATLTLTNLQATQAGDYVVTVSNEVGTITSPNAVLTLVTPPVILTQTPMPTNQLAIFEKDLTLSITVTAPGQSNGFPLAYQWKFNGTNISGANMNSYTLRGGPTNVGAYSVVVTNAAGSDSAGWQVTNFTYVGSYIEPGTLAYHLATNAVARTNGFTPGANMVQLSGWTAVTNLPETLSFVTNAVWSTNFWLKGVQGLSASSIAVMNYAGGQGSVTMISPRHFLYATHVGAGTTMAFLDANNVIHWRSTLQHTLVSGDTSLGIVESDLPSSVGFLPIVPTNLMDYLPTKLTSFVQGIGMNQVMQIFSQPMAFTNTVVNWGKTHEIPFGVSTNWSVGLGGGDSSAPERLLIGNQLVSLTHNFRDVSGPNYAMLFDAINQQMHYLSTNNSLASDYQLVPFSLTNWPTIH
jgi:hypothetical protein